MKKKELSPIEKGKIGEKYTVKYLKKKGYRIRERNMRNFVSEIDIIAETKEYIVFVEVKTRTVGQLYPPRAAVNAEKRRKIIGAAQAYLNYKRIKKPARFDIAEVYLAKDTCKVESINYLENAIHKRRRYAAF